MRSILVLVLCVALCGCGMQKIATEYLECLMLSDHATVFKDGEGTPVGLIEVRDRVRYTYGTLSAKGVDCEPINWESKDDWYAVRVATGTPFDWIALDPSGTPNTPPWLDEEEHR